MTLTSYSDTPRDLPRNTCECGNEKSIYSEACARCTYLDGKARDNSQVAYVIAVLRGTDGLSIREICEELSDDASHGNKQRSILRTVQRMLAAGRVRRYWREQEQAIVESARGIASRTVRGSSGCWVYILDGAAP